MAKTAKAGDALAFLFPSDAFGFRERMILCAQKGTRKAHWYWD